MTTASVRKAVEATLESICNRTPAYGELTKRFGPVFFSIARMRDALLKQGVRVPEIESARFAAGTPVLVGRDLSPWVEDFILSAKTLFPVLSEVLDLETDVSDCLLDHFENPDSVLGLVQARIEGDWKHFENTSVRPDTVLPTTLLYISEIVSVPVLSAIVETLGKPLSSLTWEHGHCPVCGSSPTISLLSPKEVTDLDSLVGGGGKKFLHCSQCGHDWRFKRNVCAACGNDDSETREILYDEETRSERVEACHKCGKYCLNIDLRECDPQTHLDAVQIGLIHLDIHAHDKKLTPMVSTLWNNFE
ncbi:formate dehydrogenase accessory protein FdhE [Pseudodesulfovibrio sediminis]|uniref:Formate dehydrogenase formation protein FdhE n=1 Tax=Pseudodesulfovibrio sediminis TaxID=2810563 RepID=A0ABN6EX77_9BACT|nr:formate dehydrogenase accessory protein FdhE [Pseudodesulfovibrio sediminis]BCS89825.1 formate dehydrogenase formation protein FdhE [Pseudodesulfovibrio sediminis]